MYPYSVKQHQIRKKNPSVLSIKCPPCFCEELSATVHNCCSADLMLTLLLDNGLFYVKYHKELIFVFNVLWMSLI